jgi:SnoaL-like domain
MTTHLPRLMTAVIVSIACLSATLSFAQTVPCTSSAMKNDAADRLAIVELLNRYLLVVDSKDPDAWVALFTADGTFDNAPDVARGRDQLAAFIRGWHGSGITKSIHHFMSSYAIELCGSTATVKSYYWAGEVLQAPRVVATGVFSDTVRKEDGSWRFVKRQHVLDASFKAGR